MINQDKSKTMSRQQVIMIKGLAILLIILYHFQAALSENYILPNGHGLLFWLKHLQKSPLPYWKTYLSLLFWPGFLGVNIFFVLSGYGLTQKFNHLTETITLKKLYQGMKHQIFKLYPAYFLAHPFVHLGVGLVWILIFHKLLTWQLWLSFYPPVNYLKSLLIIPRWFSNQNMFIFDGTWWFIGVIVQLYLIFPFLYLFQKKYGSKKLLFLSLTVTLLYRWLLIKHLISGPIGTRGSNTFWWVNFPARLAEFTLGMSLSTSWFKTFSNQPLKGFFLLILSLFSYFFSNLWFISDFLLALAGIWLSYYLINKTKLVTKTLFFKIGKMSYYLYLIQEPFIGLIIRGY